MRNEQKQELKRIIKEIHIEEYGNKISVLWERYGSDFSYGTFRKYFLVFKEKLKEQLKEDGNE